MVINLEKINTETKRIKKKKFTLSTKNMGVDIDKNEYYTIKESYTNYPERYFK